MADRYLLESSLVDGYLLEDGTGVLLLDIVAAPAPSGKPSWTACSPNRRVKRKLAFYPSLKLG